MLKLFRFIRAKLVVPKGVYCYKIRKIDYDNTLSDGKPIIRTNRCPYWSWDRRYPDEDVGYCKYLNLSDRDENSNGLIWDQIKECGVNDYE